MKSTRVIDHQLKKELLAVKANRDTDIALKLIKDSSLNRKTEFNPEEEKQFSDRVMKSSKNFLEEKIKASNKNIMNSSASDLSLSYHASSMDENELLDDIQAKFKEDDYLRKTAKQLQSDKVYQTVYKNANSVISRAFINK